MITCGDKMSIRAWDERRYVLETRISFKKTLPAFSTYLKWAVTVTAHFRYVLKAGKVAN